VTTAVDLAAAWGLWDRHPADPRRVADLEQAVAAWAAERGVTTTAARLTLTDARRRLTDGGPLSPAEYRRIIEEAAA